MKIQQIFGIGQQTKAATKNQNKKDLTSFGGNNSGNSCKGLVSKSAVEAIKNKYSSNLAFEGHTERLTVDYTPGEYKTMYRGTDGRISEYSSYCSSSFQKTIKEPRTVAKIESGEEEHLVGKSVNEAALLAIRHSDSCGVKDSIVEVRKPWDSKGVTEMKVYFTDEYETVSKSTKQDKDYVVYATGAHDAPEPPRRRGLLERIFGY